MFPKTKAVNLGLVILALALSLALTLPAGLVQAAMPDPAALDIVGQIGGITCAIAVQGDYAYVGVGPRLVVFDIRNPANPTPVGQTPVFPRLVYKVAAAGSYAYVTDEDDLYIVDISNPTRPTVVKTVVTPNYARGVAVAPAGSHVYVGDGYDLRVFDVSDPANPVEVGALTPSPAEVVRAIAIAGEYAYATGWGGLHVIHIADPAHPTEMGVYDTPGMARDVAAAGQYVYIADNDLLVVNVSDPAHPAPVGSCTIPGSTARSVAVAGGYAYVGGYSPAGCSLNVINVSNPAQPTEAGYVDTPGVPVGVAVAGNHVLIADDQDLLAVNVSNPAQPTVAALYQKTPFAYGVTVAGDYVYVADDYLGLRIIQAADPAALTEVGFYDSPGNALDVVVRGDYAYLADHNGGLRIIRISSPTQPVEVGVYDPDTAEAFRLALAGNYAYIADHDHNALRIVDVSNPANPTPVGVYVAPFPVTAVAVSETLFNGRRYAYIAEYEQKSIGSNSYLRVLDVANPAQPTSVGMLQNWGGAASDLAVVDGPGSARYIYLADGYPLNIINVTDPANPTLTLNIPGGYNGGYQGVAIAGNDAYFAYGGRGMTVWDISDPANPTQLVEADTAVEGRDVAVRDDAVFIADWTGGLVALAEAELRAAPASVTWLAEVDGDDPTPHAVQLTSTGRPITWTATISPTVGWLAVAPLSDTTPGTVTVTAHITGLAVGRYTATLVVTNDVNGAPSTVPVTLIVAQDVHHLYLPLVLRSSQSP
ncbi:MAG: hypothetical protein KKA73_08895 [Chloroflexi bacterium]|nr:hypothetical protein [Chloroflexota bacterium]MBU1747794.1 hypothetical protein [Chloroflexota bacterium]